MKWTGHAVGSSALAAGFRLAPGAPAAPSTPVTATRTGAEVRLANGVVDVRLATSGNDRDPLDRAGRPHHRAERPARAAAAGPARRRCRRRGVVGGRHRLDRDRAVRPGTGSCAGWPAGTGRNGAQQRPRRSCRGRCASTSAPGMSRSASCTTSSGTPTRVTTSSAASACSSTVPMSDEAHNRHIRFGTAAGGVWGEPVRVLTGLRRDPGAAVRAAQVAGTATPPVVAVVGSGAGRLPGSGRCGTTSPSCRTRPTTSRSWKRTTSAGSWLKHAGHGSRASGFGYVGGVSGGLGVGLHRLLAAVPALARHPRRASTDTAAVTLWSWSPLGGAMDLRHYDTVAHGLDLAYEDVQQGFGTPEGMARSTEMQLWALRRDAVAGHGHRPVGRAHRPPQLVAPPEWYHAAGVFGRWSLPDRSTPARAALEDSIASTTSRSTAARWTQRQWYGFWNYGDVMHTYDSDRHDVALRRRRLRLGQRRTRLRRCALVRVPALRATRRRSAWPGR